jgi:hypothetical protein
VCNAATDIMRFIVHCAIGKQGIAAYTLDSWAHVAVARRGAADVAQLHSLDDNVV